jgi:hypothetical protein
VIYVVSRLSNGHIRPARELCVARDADFNHLNSACQASIDAQERRETRIVMMKLLLVGDVMLGRLVNEVLKSEGPDNP